MFYYTNFSDFEKDIDNHKLNLSNFINQLNKKIPSRLSPYLLKYNFRDFRLLVWEYKKQNDDLIYILFRYTNHDNYIKLLNKWNNSTIDGFFNNYKGLKEKVDKWYQKQITSNNTQKTKLDQNPELSEWKQFVENYKNNKESEKFIYETRNWVYKIKEYSDSLRFICNALERAFIDQEEQLFSQINGRLTIKIDNELNVFYKYDDNENIWLLDIGKTPMQNIGYIPYRAYPVSALIDFDEYWKKIEKDEKSNLAFSPEQKAIYENPKFPLFINGPAGSGKSTILYYLFAKFLYKANAIENFNYKGIFFTYSDNLLDTAKKEIRKILDSNIGYLKLEKKINIKNFDKYFITFKDYLINLLPKQDRNALDGNYIDYYLFKNEYVRHVKHTSISPQVAWHVIRTYIRGYDIEGELNPEEYSELPRKSKTVSDEVYKKVWEIYQQKWTKDLFSKNWDELLLIKEIVNSDDINTPKYAFIFSDEAQDFTRIEINFIISLLGYFDYDLQNFTNLPIVFAGDPLQTINPTGFSWNETKRVYNDILSNYTGKITSINIVEIKQNFRNTVNINNFANRIQYLRNKFLEINVDISESKRETGDKVGFVRDFNRQTFNEWGKFTFIIPEEYEQVLPKEVSERALTVFDAKGLEYKSVVLFNFFKTLTDLDTDLSQIFKEFLSLKTEEEINKFKNDINKRIKVSYLLNKLYVAITRAEENLYIIEEYDETKELWHELNNFEIEKKYINNITQFDDNVLVEEMVGDNPLAIAVAYSEKGEREKNPKLLRKAAVYYRTAGKQGKAIESEAIADELEAKKLYETDKKKSKELYNKAAELYEEIDDKGKAINNYWIAGNIKKFRKLQKDDADIRVKISDFILHPDITHLNKLLDERRNSVFEEMKKTFVPDLLKQKLKHFIENNNLSQQLIEDLFEFFRNNNEFKEIITILLAQAYNNEFYELAIEIAEHLEQTNIPIYHKSKLALLEDDNLERISHWNALGEKEAILTFMRKYITNFSQNNIERYEQILKDTVIEKGSFDDFKMLYPLIYSKRDFIEKYINKRNTISLYENYYFTQEIIRLSYNNFDFFRKFLSKENLAFFALIKTIKEIENLIEKAELEEYIIDIFKSFIEGRSEAREVKNFINKRKKQLEKILEAEQYKNERNNQIFIDLNEYLNQIKDWKQFIIEDIKQQVKNNLSKLDFLIIELTKNKFYTELVEKLLEHPDILTPELTKGLFIKDGNIIFIKNKDYCEKFLKLKIDIDYNKILKFINTCIDKFPKQQIFKIQWVVKMMKYIENNNKKEEKQKLEKDLNDRLIKWNFKIILLKESIDYNWENIEIYYNKQRNEIIYLNNICLIHYQDKFVEGRFVNNNSENDNIYIDENLKVKIEFIDDAIVLNKKDNDEKNLLII